MNCHFVYSVPFQHDKSLVGKITRKIPGILSKVGIPFSLVSNRQPTSNDFESWPIQSPYENTQNIYRALSKIMPTFLYHLTEYVHPKFQKDDVFLGHPYFPHNQGRLGVTELALKRKNRPKIVAIITPLHCDVTIKTNHINKDFLDDVDKLLPAADLLFGIMGKYWWDQWDLSPYSHWKSKMVRLDMAVDTTRYPRVKRSFNAPGKRGYLYIGNSNDPRKGVEYLNKIMSQLKDYPRGWIGGGIEISNVPRISNARQLTPEFMKDIANKYDFFISPSIADPNPTTILESMSWGFPVACTQESGYYETDYMKNIYLDNVAESVDILKKLQYADERDLILMSDQARKRVETDYNWDKFTTTIIKNLGLLPR